MTTLLNRKRGFLAILFCAACSFAQAQSATPAAPAPAHDFARWEKDVAAFEASDRTAPPPKNALLFLGSSTIVRWKTLQQDYPAHQIINRGFGGNEIADSTHLPTASSFPISRGRSSSARAATTSTTARHPSRCLPTSRSSSRRYTRSCRRPRSSISRSHQHRPLGRTGRREEAQCAHRGLREPHTTPEIHRNLRPGARCQGRTPAGALRRGQAALQPRGLQAAHRAGPPVRAEMTRSNQTQRALYRCSPGRRSVPSGR